ncbi:ribosomal protein L1 [Ascodesmis nigricans]|uniref:Ribosomal protein L1 n=1 Tax=Ascodesmis nigricans TaxID=341454 RepID=A0A4S2N3X6_9PEZI|nr:ribosomal protein L1 [Ascodesmis nigricans]
MARSKQSKKPTQTAPKPPAQPKTPIKATDTSTALTISKKAKAAAEAVAKKVTSESPYQLNKTQVVTAATALQKWLANKPSLVPNLLADPEDASSAANPVAIWLVLSTKKYIVDERKLKPVRIPLAHSISSASATGAAPSVCLIVKDPQRKFKDIVALSSPLSGLVTKVVGVGKLKKKYKSFESKRLLCEAHDVFLADDRIITMLPKILGNAFYKKTTKVPIPVSIDGKDTPAQLEKEINKSLNSTYLHLQPAASTSVRVAMSSFTPEQIAENVIGAVDELTSKRIPGGWRNLKALHIKTPESAALPIWMTADVYTDEDVLKPEEEQERIRKEAEKAAERVERKKIKNAKKRKGLSDAPVQDEDQSGGKKAKVDEKE